MSNSMTVCTRLTPTAVDKIDRLARETALSRGAVITCLLLSSLARDDVDEMFDIFRERAQRRGRP